MRPKCNRCGGGLHVIGREQHIAEYVYDDEGELFFADSELDEIGEFTVTCPKCRTSDVGWKVELVGNCERLVVA